MIRNGDRVELVRTGDRYTKLKPGTKGTVTSMNRITSLGEPFTQIGVNWDDGSTLMMVPESGDRIRVIDEG